MERGRLKKEKVEGILKVEEEGGKWVGKGERNGTGSSKEVGWEVERDLGRDLRSEV
jgi:hypothetical protein